MSFVFALLFAAQAVQPVGNPDVTIAEPTPELAQIHACLVKETNNWLIEFNWEPEDDLRWRWATKIVDQCRKGWVKVLREGKLGGFVKDYDRNVIGGEVQFAGITPHHLLKSEALYYVDRLIREHFEAKAFEAKAEAGQ